MAIGAIRLAATGTTYLTTSDYRLKQDIRPLEGAIERLNGLKPCRFAFKAEADRRVDGFIAHEVAQIVPEAVSGEKDAVDASGDIVPQAVDVSRLVPLLVAALQELTGRVKALEARP
jgi:hypothetical protein